MVQPPNTGSLEQVLRCLVALADSPAFALEMQAVASHMGAGAFQPGAFADADGGSFLLNLSDVSFGDPAEWLPTAFRQVLPTEQLLPVPPYPLLSLIAQPGRVQRGSGASMFEVDTGELSGWVYVIDAITVASADRPQIAARRALGLMQGFERLVRRNRHLGGLVQLIAAEGPPEPGGTVETGKHGVLSGVRCRFQVEALAGLL